jgi:hypothetical protein
LMFWLRIAFGFCKLPIFWTPLIECELLLIDLSSFSLRFSLER